MKISKIVILQRSGTDLISIFTDLPSPYPQEVGDGLPLVINFETTKGWGVDYVKKNFGIEPEVIKRGD